MRILFIGSTKRGWRTCEALCRSKIQMAGIISLAQHPHENDRYESQFRDLARQYGVPLFESTTMKERDFASLIQHELAPDIAIVVGARVLFDDSVIQAPRMGTLAVHDSLLPAYRGFAPLNWAILNGETETGVTLFQLTQEMDAGDIISQVKISIGPHDTAAQVYEKSCEAAVALVLGAVEQAAKNGELEKTPQDPTKASYTCSRSPEDGIIRWNLPTKTIYNQIRALSHPFPGAFTTYKAERLFIHQARPVENPRRFVGRIPGKIVAVTQEGYLEVLTSDGILQIREASMGNNPPELPSNLVKSVREMLGRE